MIFAVDKPQNISSYDVIRLLKKRYPGEKIGHGGTLDPLASGVLVIGVGKESTRALHQVLKNVDKEYVAEIELGSFSETDDAEGPIQKKSDYIPHYEEVYTTLSSFIGNIEQIPPKYSSIKIKGIRAYRRTRNGEEIVLEPRILKIHSIVFLNYTYPLITIHITTGSGVYIRSLARDIGQKLGTGGYLRNLRRVRVGDFSIQSTFNPYGTM